MSSKVKVDFSFTGDTIMKKVFTKKAVTNIGKEILELIKDNTSKGITSVKGGSRRFAKYKDSSKYPGKRKPARPVNLKLSGDMLSSLSVQVKVNSKGFKIVMFFDDLAQAIKYEGLHKGVIAKPKRPRKMIPIKSNEKFSASVNKKITKMFNDLVKKGTRKQNQGGK